MSDRTSLTYASPRQPFTFGWKWDHNTDTQVCPKAQIEIPGIMREYTLNTSSPPESSLQELYALVRGQGRDFSVKLEGEWVDGLPSNPHYQLSATRVSRTVSIDPRAGFGDFAMIIHFFLR